LVVFVVLKIINEILGAMNDLINLQFRIIVFVINCAHRCFVHVLIKLHSGSSLLVIFNYGKISGHFQKFSGNFFLIRNFLKIYNPNKLLATEVVLKVCCCICITVAHF